jgi:hypothetical protein
LTEHAINEITDRAGELVGATVLLSPDEVEELQESGSVEIELG